MPAIHLPRLQQQVERLVLQYADPNKFSRQLRDLYMFYGDKTLRPSQKSKKTVGLPSENIPLPVLRQIVAQMTPYAENTPHAILNLVRNLWPHQVLEFRQLAAMLIGKIPVSHAEETLALVQEWGLKNQEELLLTAISSNSLNILQRQTPDALLEWIQSWLAPNNQDLKPSEVTNLQKLGLNALLPFAKNPEFENLPRIYSLIKPLLHRSTKTLRPYLLDLLLPLARRSPQEIAYILRRMLEEDPNAHLIWLARRTLAALPPENQTRLQALISPRKED